jgi:hypothetical protein
LLMVPWRVPAICCGSATSRQAATTVSSSLLILSIDGSGVVTRHLPIDGNVAVALRNDGTVLLDNAYELDDAPAWECFYFVTADEPFDVGPVLAAAQRAAAVAPRLPPSLPLVRGLRQSTFTLQKEVKP